MSEIVVNEGIQVQGTREEIVRSVTFTGASSVSAPTVAVYRTDTGADVTATVMPTGSPAVAGIKVTLPKLKVLTDGLTYRHIVLATVDGGLRAAVLDVIAKDEKTI